jgi:hypothetical protein
MNQLQKDAALRCGIVKAKIMRVLLEATVMHVGWEFDNKGWVVECEDGSIVGLTTNHGAICAWKKGPMDIDAALKRTRASANEIEACLQLLEQTRGKK